MFTKKKHLSTLKLLYIKHPTHKWVRDIIKHVTSFLQSINEMTDAQTDKERKRERKAQTDRQN